MTQRWKFRAAIAAAIFAVLLGGLVPAVAAQGGMSKININQADLEELQSLRGIGPSLATRIIEYREKHGPFRRIEDLMNVRGIGETSFLKLREQITVKDGSSERA